MADAKPLLIEIGCEELPIHAVDALAQAFAKGVCEGLSKRGIASDTEHARVFATPRRLAVLVPGVASVQSEQRSESLGPHVNIALDADGLPTRALQGFAGKLGVDWKHLDRVTDAKGERFVHRNVSPGRATAELVPEIVREAATALPVPKPMRWGNHDFAFVRPVHWLVMLLGSQVVDGELFGVKSGRQSRGHRFMHPAPVHLVDAESYLDSLRAANVLANPQERENKIDSELASAVGQLRAQAGNDGLSAHIDADNIAAVKNLTEWPVGIACSFGADYLHVPREALIATMQDNQKFFPVFDGNGGLTEHFIGIANLESKDPAQIRHGYERVVRPRFADAKFFFDEDLKTPLTQHQQELQSVTYQKSLGSVWDKTVRVAELASAIAERLFAQGIEVDSAQAAHAAGLSRCDLMTRMVGEFPELQGVMGRHYAAAQGQPAEVANALDQFYRPRKADDGIAEGALAQCLSLADKLDTLVGIFAVGMKPTGNRDPFALRRAALGVARTLIEGGLDLDFEILLREHAKLVRSQMREVATALKQETSRGHGAHTEGGDPVAPLVTEVYAFILDRLRGYYAEKGFPPQQFEAVAAVHPASLMDFDRRLHAVAAFGKQPEAEALAAANKRVANILRKEGVDEVVAAARPIDEALLREPAERALADALHAAEAENAVRLEGDTARRDYEGALARLAQLQAPIDAFFEGVMVVAEDAALRENRITLLARIKARFDAIAEIARL
jgi:glycyl-tRNA synthetase beta chain